MSADRPLCVNCGYAGSYPEPAPLPRPVERSLLWGLIRWLDGPDPFAADMHDYQVRRARECVPCFRYPEAKMVSKAHWCGEHQPSEVQP